ncbi:MAG: aminotransferase class I/II-fold pyridoxal phosphate-dependent enzyme [Patescibacteria group bacterium]
MSDAPAAPHERELEGEENPIRDHAERIMSGGEIGGIQKATHEALLRVIDRVFNDETLIVNFKGADIRRVAMSGNIIAEIWRRIHGDPEMIQLLTIGDTEIPPFMQRTVERIIKRAHIFHMDAIREGKTGYDVAAKGTEETRRALMKFLDRYYGFSEQTDRPDLMKTLTKQTCVVHGGMTGLDYITAGLIQRADNKGAKHNFVWPSNSFGTWPSIANMRSRNGAVADTHIIKSEQKHGLHLTPEQVTTYYKEHQPAPGKTTSWYITPVGNPSGTKITPRQLQGTCEAIVKNDPEAVIILDLVYLRMLKVEEARALMAGIVGNAEVFNRVIVLDSFSKTHGLCGERAGLFFSANPDLFTDPQNVMMLLTAGVSKQTDCLERAIAMSSDGEIAKFDKLHEFWRKEVEGLYYYLIKSGEFKHLFDEDQSHINEAGLKDPTNLYLCLKLKNGVDSKQILAETHCLGVEDGRMQPGTYMRFAVGKIRQPTFAKYAPKKPAST